MLAWPADLPLPFNGAYAPFIRSASGGQAEDGTEQVQPQFKDRWSAGFSFHLGTDDRVLAARALITGMRGCANTVLLPAFDHSRAPWSRTVTDPPFYTWWPSVAGTPFEFVAAAGVTGTLTLTAASSFSFAATGAALAPGMALDLAGEKRILMSVTGGGPYLCVFRPALNVLAADDPRTVAARLNSAASLNAVSVDIGMQIGGAPKPGHLFSLGTRMYAIDSVAALGDGIYRCAIWPWLRADAFSGATVNFVSPACEMRFASDEEGQEALKALGLKSMGDITLRFDEASA